MIIETIKIKELLIFSELFLGITIIYLVLFGTFLSYNKNYRFPLLQNSVIYLGALIVSMACFLFFNDNLIVLNYLNFSNTIVNDYLSFSSKILIGITSTVCLLMIQQYLIDQKINHFEYVLIILFAILGLFLMCSANDLITAYLSIELQSLAFYILAAFKKNSTFSIEVGLKYFILGAFSSGLFLFGSSLIYGITGSINFENFKDLFYCIFPGSGLVLQKFNNHGDLDLLFYQHLFNESENKKLLNNFNENDHLIKLQIIYNKMKYIQKDLFKMNGCDFETIYCEHLLFLQKNFKFNDHHYIIIKKIYDRFNDLVSTTYDLNDQEKNFDYRYIRNSELHFFYPLILKKYNLLSYGQETGIIIKDIIKNYGYDDDNKNYSCFLLCKEISKKTKAFSNLCLSLQNNNFFCKYFFFEFLNLIDLYTTDSIEFFKKDNFQIRNYFYNSFNISLLQFALVFIFISLFFKLALAPFHLWSPDIYEGSPSSSTFFFAVVPKLGIFILLLRICFFGFYGLMDNWRYYVVIIGILSIIIGSFVGLEQRKLKSLLAYSSISHMGYLLITFSTGTIEGIQMLFSYLIIYMCSGLCIWSIFIVTRLKNNYLKKQNKDLADLVLLSKSNSMLTIILSITLLSIAGLPPMIGFIVKLGLFLTIMESSMYFIALLGILFSVISTFYYIRILKILYFEKILVGKLYYPIKTQKIFIISLLFYLFLFLFINPTLLYLFSYKISLLIC